MQGVHQQRRIQGQPEDLGNSQCDGEIADEGTGTPLNRNDSGRLLQRPWPKHDCSEEESPDHQRRKRQIQTAQQNSEEAEDVNKLGHGLPDGEWNAASCDVTINGQHLPLQLVGARLEIARTTFQDVGRIRVVESERAMYITRTYQVDLGTRCIDLGIKSKRYRQRQPRHSRIRRGT